MYKKLLRRIETQLNSMLQSTTGERVFGEYTSLVVVEVYLMLLQRKIKTGSMTAPSLKVIREILTTTEMPIKLCRDVQKQMKFEGNLNEKTSEKLVTIIQTHLSSDVATQVETYLTSSYHSS